jgi:hypothetical protein
MIYVLKEFDRRLPNLFRWEIALTLALRYVRTAVLPIGNQVDPVLPLARRAVLTAC